ncbi:ethanolamine ammonia-lyase subunit EutB [Actinospica sp.]|uniref:ethanolamine ammonia-lyase subunit EutB n=1 Tax=Actinospica sp. TaxID=1872142 RepID=UPI002C32096F|nr:ethanolamine ammonia-lyase subunit EutB [Actinospica sp.]HWG24825.1 ethanolamine ammonia-lyase subunit EutB [Actinospica sp.]
MTYRAVIRGEGFGFASLRELLAAANEEKSGDQLAGIAARDERERVAAKIALADVRLSEIVAEPLIDDEVTAAVSRPADPAAFAEIAALTVGEFREFVLDQGFAARWSSGLAAAITPEIAAACAKLMSNLDLVAAPKPLRVETRCRNVMGGEGVLGVRAQPNHPTDDVSGILLSALDGLGFGCGDAMIGVNPATEAVGTVAAILHGLHDLIGALGVPTQTSVLAHITTQLAALETGAPVDLLFQSVAGTEGANRSFGVDLALLAEGRAAVVAQHASRPGEFVGDQVMYFETGQGSALSAEAHHGVDQLTIEARAQAVARLFDPFLVNSVVGFIGPEYLADATQITRAGLEDHFVGKLMGVPTGIDVCYTNHVNADQNSNDALLVLLAAAGCGYVMGVPGGDDVMLNYQTTSYHDVATVRRTLGLRPAPAFEAWLEANGLWRDGAPAPRPAWPTSLAELDVTAAVSGRPVRELLARAAA